MSREVWATLLAMPTAELPLSFVDVETTGLYARGGDRICEVAVVHCQGRREVERFATLVNPCRDISPAAASVNGITADMVRQAPRFASVALEVVRLLNAGVAVAHNAPFDLSFLAQELANAGMPLPQMPVMDTLALARHCFSFRSNNLGHIAASLGIPGAGHRALSDALTTRAVLARFLELLEARHDRPLTLADMLDLQGGASRWLPPEQAPTVPLPPGLAELVELGGPIRLSYVSAAGTVTERLVDPLELATRGGRAYLVGYCHLRHEQRTFKIDRILRWERG